MTTVSRSKLPPEPALSSEQAELPSDRTLEPDREARRALANTLVVRGTGPDLRGATIDDIPTISMGHGALEDPPAELEVVSALGVGGTGHVYLARQRSLHRDVAVKVLNDDAADLGVCLVYEARVATRIDHPNVVPVYLLGRTSDGMPVLVMKRIRGVSWLELVEGHDHPMWSELAGKRERLLVHLEIFLAICNAAGAAHRQGIIHRDIKPSNVMVAGPGEIYLTDWGIAFDRAAPPPPSPGSLVGTPAYMAPEMLTGRAIDLDERTDIFMLGASLHFALTGRYRNEGATNEAAIQSLRELAPYRYGADVPEELAAICNRATAVPPSERFATIAELREAVQTFLYHHESYRMAERARAQVEEAAGLPRWDATVARRLDQLRVVLHGALEAWPDNPLALATLDRVRVLQADLELARDNVAAARANLDELALPPPELVTRVTAREAEEALRRERDARHAALERDLDLRTAARTRRWFFLLLALYGLAAGVAFVVLRTGKGEDPSGLRAVIFSITATSFCGTMLFIARREILGNRINRTIIGLVGGYLLFNLLHRLVAYQLDGSPRLTLTVDIISAGIIAGIGALMVTPRLWIVPVVCLVGVVVAVLAPATAQISFGVCSAVMIWRMLHEWGSPPAP